MHHRFSFALFAMGVGLLVSGCETFSDYHGKVLKTSDLASLRPQSTHQNDVRALLGTPTCIFPHEPRTWYYLGEVRQMKALQKPWVSEVSCCAIHFDANGKIIATETSFAPIPLSMDDEETPLPTAKDPSFFQKVFGNVGRFESIRMGPPR